MEKGQYRFKQTGPEIQELLDMVPAIDAGEKENSTAIETLTTEVSALSEDVEELKNNEIRVTYWELVSKLQSAKLVSGKVRSSVVDHDSAECRSRLRRVGDRRW